MGEQGVAAYLLDSMATAKGEAYEAWRILGWHRGEYGEMPQDIAREG